MGQMVRSSPSYILRHALTLTLPVHIRSYQEIHHTYRNRGTRESV